MTDEQTLLAAIIARPLDDQMRLGYADWLEETATRKTCPPCYGKGKAIHMGTGGSIPAPPCGLCHGTGEVSNGHAERAEFIRVQCELARLIGDGSRCSVCGGPIRPAEGCEPDNCCFRPGEHSSEYAGWHRRQTHFHALRRRERELLAKHYRAILSVIPEAEPWYNAGHGEYGWVFRREDGGPRFTAVTLRRGLVEEWGCSWPDFRTHADAIRRATPLREVTLTTEPELDGRGIIEITDSRRLMEHLDYPGIEFELPPRESFEREQQEGDSVATFNIPVRTPRYSFVMRAE